MKKSKSTIIALLLAFFLYPLAGGYFYLGKKRKAFIWLSTMWSTTILMSIMNANWLVLIIFIGIFYTIYDCYRISKKSQPIKKSKITHSKSKNHKLKINDKTFDPKIHVKEYKRTCNECGKTWHSLTSREDKIQKDLKLNQCDQFVSACGMCGGNWSALGASTQAKRNEHALIDELTRLKRCPECGSGNYKETVVHYEKK